MTSGVPDIDAFGTGAEPTGGHRAVVVLDGGMSNALEERGHDLADDLWTARVLRDAPADVAAVHEAYYRAGARVATTASYQASVQGFVAAGLDRAEARQLITRSVTVAREVRDRLADDGTTRWVAASVGPYGAVVADGSEYRGRYGLSRAALRDFHRPRLELLAAAGPDLLAVETIPDVDEAEVLVELLDEVGLPAWFSFSSQGLETRAGQPLAEAFSVAASARCVFATGVNCCSPSDVLPAVVLAARISGKPAVAYPNSGEEWVARTHRWEGGSSYDVRLAAEWVEAGAGYVGGCCRVGPRDIAALAAAVT
ncbi:MAG TPA: homocysteine S-methyltransferase [Nocardioidaceae bacterium]|nr:homocysteine S-methyltransferase [Nocardioidaceae bacterium]